MKNTFTAITSNERFLNSLTADEKTFEAIEKGRKSDKDLAKSLGWSASKFNRIKWNVFGKKREFGTREVREFLNPIG